MTTHNAHYDNAYGTHALGLLAQNEAHPATARTHLTHALTICDKWGFTELRQRIHDDLTQLGS